MILTIDDWVFEVDVTATMAYSGQEAQEHCTCVYCRNFYAAVDSVYPNLRPFLAEFGVHIEAPDELVPYEPPLMEGFYTVCGKVLQFGSKPACIDGLSICVADPEDLHVNVFCPTPYFVLNTGFMELPWVLEEQIEDVVSPANEPSFLEDMTNRMLCLFPENNIQ